MATRRVLRWTVPVDGDEHEIGGGQVLMIASRSKYDEVEVWTLEETADGWPQDGGDAPNRLVAAFGTGHTLTPDASEHIGSTVASHGLVWHVFKVGERS